MTILVQHDRYGSPATEGCFLAAAVAGGDYIAFERLDDVEVTPETLVVGGIGTVVKALRTLGVEVPVVEYPEPLRPFLLDPGTSVSTMGQVRRSPERWPVFVKPVGGFKLFTGLVVRSTANLLSVTHVDDEAPVYVAQPVDLRGVPEWRCFIVDGVVRDVRPYARMPDGSMSPPLRTVQAMVDCWDSVPAGCGMDVVLTDDGWRVVECNDGYALGPYGVDRRVYFEMLVKRWAELTGSEGVWRGLF